MILMALQPTTVILSFSYSTKHNKTVSQPFCSAIVKYVRHLSHVSSSSGTTHRCDTAHDQIANLANKLGVLTERVTHVLTLLLGSR